MKVSGSLILDTLTTLREEAQLVKNEFSSSLSYYKDEAAKETPQDLMDKYIGYQVKIAKLQELQSAYNLYVKVDVNGKSMSLTRAINLLGDIGFAKNQWAAQIQESYRGYREKDIELPVKAVNAKTAKILTREATRTVAAYKAAIREGNLAHVEFGVLVRKYDLNIDESIFVTEE